MTEPALCCLNCHHTQLRDRGNDGRNKILREHGQNGWMVCNLSDYRSDFHHKHHFCDKHLKASDTVVQLRRNWFAANQRKLPTPT
jgi:hypothetical protein